MSETTPTETKTEDPEISAETPVSSEAEQAQTAADDRLVYVGIASSAGGLEAVTALVQNLPKAVNAVYIIAQHMSPTHKSVLQTLLARETHLPVEELSQSTEPKPDTIYVTPPASDVVIEDGILRLRNPSRHTVSPKPSADRLFKSLAEECGEYAVGIVMSGTGSDGSYGVQSIREAGGITISQDAATTKYDGMPMSAVETGCIDLTLSPEQIGQHLEKILARPRNLDAFKPVEEFPNRLSELFGILLARTRVDFTDYKEKTLNRRIARRMAALGVADYDDYVDYCRTNVDEVDALHRDLLISVTRFFRDPEQFESLRAEMSMTLASRPVGPIRVWVVGCATGEEAYSIAIMISEILGGIEELAKHNVQIFATDIDQNAVEVARRGVYPITAIHDIPQEYLSQYFIAGESELTVRQELRAVTLFSRHNVFQDPPFINVDLVTIRNVLIYFNLALQERVLSRLHYAIGAGGLLFLGNSETVGEMGVYFESRQNSDKVFGKRRGISGELSVEPGTRMYSRRRAPMGSASTEMAPAVASKADMSLARAIAPNGMICTRDGKIIEVLGDLSHFIEIRAGAATALNIKMLIDPLRTEAATLIAVALRHDGRKDGRWHGVSLPIGNRIQMQAFPFQSYGGGETHCLVAINAKFEDAPGAPAEETSSEEQRAYVERIEAEIRSTEEALQQTIEELQTANEELQSANEELQSTNEEFQATNEELETSNEELQSTNEELLTVNEELQTSAAERQSLASELEATMSSAPYVVALADQALILRRLSDAAKDLFSMTELPANGLHLSQINLPAGFPALAPIANTVLRVQEPRRLSILSEGQYHLLVMSPVRDVHNQILGISITITQYDSEPMAQIVDIMSDVTKVAHWTYNLDTDELFWSSELFRIYGRDVSGEPPIWEDTFSLIHPEDRVKERTAMENLIEGGTSISSEWRVFGPDGRIISVRGSAVLVRDYNGAPVQLIGVLWDQARDMRNEIMLSSFESVQEELGLGFFSFDVENNLPVWNDQMYEILGFDRVTHTPSVESLLQVFVEDDRTTATQAFQDAVQYGKPFRISGRVSRQGGGTQSCDCVGKTRLNESGRVTHVFGSLVPES